MVNVSETGSDGKFFLATFTTSFLSGQEISEPIDVIIKLPNGFYLRHKRCKNPSSYLETLTAWVVKIGTERREPGADFLHVGN